ncbi:MAG TPA: hypothetical protein VLR93_01925 [Patescibacteria group bacterium]|nr:hypothetical protein [Patescibacteria group bacterium]
MSRPFHPSELIGADGGVPSSAELRVALQAARTLEFRLGGRDVHPSAEFADRVMAAVAVEPRPQPAIAAGLAMRRGRFGSMTAALADSWRVAFSGGRPLAVRAQAAAFVLVAVLAAGSLGGLAAVGAVRVLAPAPRQIPLQGPILPTIGPTHEPPAPTAQPTPTAALPTPSARPTDEAQPTGAPGASRTDGPGKAPGPTKTPRPTRTPRDTPEPTETEDPTDDSGHGGSGGGGDGGEVSTPDP